MGEQVHGSRRSAAQERPGRPRKAAAPRGSAGRSPGPPAVVFVEGARDRDILAGWARRGSPGLARAVRDAAVILGGKRPARARAHLARLRASHPGAAGICILDRDDGAPEAVESAAGEGLELFIWSRRHIESYLLVAGAIRRGLGRAPGGQRFERLLRASLPAGDDESALRDAAAKHLLSGNGPLARALGRPLPLGRIARAMRPEELHPDVHALLARLEALLGPTPPQILRRPPR